MSAHADMPVYNRLVFHSVLETAILGQLAEVPAYMVPLYDAARAAAITAKEALIKKARALSAEWDGKTESMSFFQMGIKYKFGELATRLESLA
jgi:hypothetical protein